jgi:undecaprenyl-diphosphatase
MTINLETLMTYFEAIMLAIVQALTEFLPVSSSGHLILVPKLFGWSDQGLLFDVALHVGSLLAVLTYFHKELLAIVKAWLKALRRQSPPDPEAMFGWYILVATIPVGLAGLLFHDFITTYLRSPLVIAATAIIFGTLLWLVDRRGGKGRGEHTMNLTTALLIGCAQALALIPGTSRSGITMTAGIALGLSRLAAARFSFLLSVPGIAMAGLYEGSKLFGTSEPVQWDMLAVGVVVSALAAYLCIRFFLKLIAHISLLPFAIYRVLLGIVLLIVYL